MATSHFNKSNQQIGFFFLFTAHKRSLGQGNVYTRVCHSVHRREGGCVSQHAMGRGVHLLSKHPPRQTHPGQTPPRQTPASGQTPPHPGRSPLLILRDTVNKWAVRILVECILVWKVVQSHRQGNEHADVLKWDVIHYDRESNEKI